MRISLDERFTPVELFGMFNVELGGSRKDGQRTPQEDYPYGFGALVNPLWSLTKTPRRRGFEKAMSNEDNCTVIDAGQPGTEKRISALREHYASQEGGVGPQGEVVYREDAISAFDVDGDEYSDCPSCGCPQHTNHVYCTGCGYRLDGQDDC